MTRSRTRLAVWLVAFLILYTALAWTFDDYSICTGSAVVGIDQLPVINPSTCQ